MAPPLDPQDPFQSQSAAKDAPAPKPQAAPPPRPVRPPPIARPHKAAGPFADLPDLPKMAVSVPKRNLTLVGMLQGVQKTGRGRGRFVLWGLGFTVFLVILSSALYRRTLVKHFVPKRVAVQSRPAAPIAAVLTPQQQGARALAAGSEAYSHRDYGKAVANFEEALNLDPTLADAHRSLGIVHADLHDEAEAIAHYQKYIEMVPHGHDAVRVKKIIDDYNIAHAPPPEAPPPAPIKSPVRSHRTGKAYRR